MNARVRFPQARLARLCERRGVKRLAVYGSALRDDFGPDSDVDVLVEFLPDVRVGLLGLAELENELSDLVGRDVDLCTPGFFGDEMRRGILADAEVCYDAA